MNRHEPLFTRIVAMLSLLLLASPAAAFTNGDFSTGDLTGWIGMGDANVSPISLIAPGVGNPNEFLILTNHSAGETPLSGNPALAAALLATNSALPIADMNALSPSGSGLLPFEGAVAYQDLTAGVGAQIDFDWAFFTNEGVGETDWTDFAFWAIVDMTAGTTLMTSLLAQPTDTAAATLSGSIYTNHSTSLNSATYTFGNASNFRVIVGVVDVDDGFFESAAVFDNFVLTTPEPGTHLLLGLGLLGLAFAGRRPR